MAFSLVDSFTFTPGANGGTSAGRTTTGANFFVGCFGHGGNTTITNVSDSVNGNWTPRTLYKNGTGAEIQIWYFENGIGASSGHTFSITGTSIFPSCIIFSFSGGPTSAAFDIESGASAASGTSIQPGSVTPSAGATNSLIISGLGLYISTDSVSMPTGYTGNSIPFGTGLNYQGAGAYKIKTDANAENPTWSWTTSGTNASDIAIFKAAATVGGGGPLMDNGELISGGPLIKGRLINYPVYHPENILRMRQGRRLKKVA